MKQVNVNDLLTYGKERARSEINRYIRMRKAPLTVTDYGEVKLWSPAYGVKSIPLFTLIRHEKQIQINGLYSAPWIMTIMNDLFNLMDLGYQVEYNNDMFTLTESEANLWSS